jgi:hypothetical protein
MPVSWNHHISHAIKVCLHDQVREAAADSPGVTERSVPVGAGSPQKKQRHQGAPSRANSMFSPHVRQTHNKKAAGARP